MQLIWVQSWSSCCDTVRIILKVMLFRGLLSVQNNESWEDPCNLNSLWLCSACIKILSMRYDRLNLSAGNKHFHCFCELLIEQYNNVSYIM